MLIEKLEPRRIPTIQMQTWGKLISPRRRLKVTALGREWEFRFLLATSVPQNSVAASVRLGDHLAIIQCGLLPGGRWLQEVFRGPGVESIQEPFRTAVVGVFLQDFLFGLSQSSRLPIHLMESNHSEPGIATWPLYWQMLNDFDEPEIVGSLTAGEGFISEIRTAAATWPVSPWKLPESLRMSVDVLIGLLSLSGEECASLEVGDTLLLGCAEGWRRENLWIRVNQGRRNGSLIPIKPTRATIENAMFSRMNLYPKNQNVVRAADAEGSAFSELKISNLDQEFSEENMASAEYEESEASPSRASWASSEEGGGRWMDSVEVVLEFSLGRQSISLGELRRIGQGHMFPIQTPSDCLVNILLQGQSIGRGELVRVGEEIGILVRELEQSGVPPQINAAAITSDRQEKIENE